MSDETKRAEKAEAEVERLNKAVDDLTVRHRLSPCHAERDRYRGALEEIAKDVDGGFGAERTAKRALDQQEES